MTTRPVQLELPGNEKTPPQAPTAADRERVLLGVMSNLDGMLYRCSNDSDWSMEFVSEGCFPLTGYRPEELLFNHSIAYAQVVHPEDRQRLRHEIRAAARGKQRFLAEHRIICQDGSIKWVWARGLCVLDADDNFIGIEGFIEDITKVKLNREKLEYLANHDPVTNLPNRLLFNDRLRRMMVNAGRSHSVVVVALIDLDNFKLINDTFGHNRGDELLQTVAQRMQSCLRESDTVARLGGDEFVLLLSGENRGEAVSLAVQRVLKAVARPWQFDTQELSVSCSIGVSIFPRDGRDVQTLLKNADAAMYKAKELGKNNYQFYSPEMNTAIAKRLELQNLLQRALEKGQFVLMYQPKIDLGTGKVAGMEALLRIADESRLLLPQDFIKLAEETGMIVPIGEWVLRQACAFNKFLQDRKLPAMPVAINLSARQLVRYDLVSAVEQALHDTGLPAEYLELELTESMVMHNPEDVIKILERLETIGVLLGIDDFGTGYSSLSYLKRFPVNTLKIDRSFVHEVGQDADASAIARAVITLGHSLGLKVVAEGAETEQQIKFLQENHCDYVQGFFFSKPLLPDEFVAMLEEKERGLTSTQSKPPVPKRGTAAARRS